MRPWTLTLTIAGSIGILLGSLDPMEGSVLILLGSGLVALGTYLGHSAPRLARYWLLIFILNGVGVGAMFALGALGGIGGTSGHSLWWGVLTLPYVLGWIMALVRIFTTAAGLIKARLAAPRRRA